MANPSKSSIEIHGLQLNIRLGWEKEERQKPQTILVDISLKLPAPPKACQTDELSDTVCYAELIAAIKQEIESKEFKLVEHLSYKIYHLLQKNLPADIKIQVRLAKMPEITQLTGGISFCYGDE